MRKILLIEAHEGDAGAREPLAPALGREGLAVVTITAGAAVPDRWAELAPDLVVLDLACPGPGGTQLCRWLRARSTVPIIILAAWDDEDDMVHALAAGADDYLTRPCSVRELVARIGAVLRRTDQTGELLPKILEAGDVRMDLGRYQLSVRGQRVTLPLGLFTLLAVLMRHQGQVISREELADRFGLTQTQGNPKTVNTYIRRLRTVIETDPGWPRHLKTVRGRGYIFDP